MITENRVREIQKKINAAIAEIAKEEKVSIDFSSLKYTASFYTANMKITTKEITPEVDKVNKGISKQYGFSQDIIGMSFEDEKGRLYKITEIKTRNRKYPIIAHCINDGRSYKFDAPRVKRLIGGNKIVNRNSNLKSLLGEK